MTNFQNIFLKVNFPIFFKIFLSICSVGILFISGVYFYKIVTHQLQINYFFCSVFFFLDLGGFWIILKLLFYSVTATNKGIEARNIIVGKTTIQWEDILEVRRPSMGIPKDISYIITKNNNKLLLIRSMKNYSKIIQLIKKMALNLKSCDY